jgi:CRP/FNR family cyclic AMP-dependent transcriptional regulator
MIEEVALNQEERAALNQWRWFASLPAVVRHDLLRHSRLRRYRSGEVIHAREEGSSCLLACASGAVRISAQGANGKELVLTYVQPGVWFAGPDLFDGRPPTHEAVAVGNTAILSLGRAKLERLLSGSRDLCTAVLCLQARHTRSLYETLEAVNSLPLRPRLAKQLASLAQRHGLPAGNTDGEIRIGLRVAQHDLAQLVGSSRQRVNQELKQMERAGWIRVERLGLVICNRAALQAECQAH